MKVLLNGIELPAAKEGVTLDYIRDLKGGTSANGRGFRSGISTRRTATIETTALSSRLAESFNRIVLGDHHLVDLRKGVDTDTGIKRLFDVGGIGWFNLGVVGPGDFFPYANRTMTGSGILSYAIRSESDSASVLSVARLGDGRIVNMSISAHADDGEVQFIEGVAGESLVISLVDASLPSTLYGVGMIADFTVNMYNSVFIPYQVDDYILRSYPSTEGKWPGSGSVFLEVDNESILCEGFVESMSIIESPDGIKYKCRYKFEEVEDGRFLY